MTEHSTLAAALVGALGALSVVEKNHTANAGQFSYEYADIAAVVAATRPTLAEHGIVALTPVVDNGDGLACTVVLLHSSGERMEFGPFSFPRGKDAQATGSMVTYHRRYALLSALGMAAGDDDGATAQAQQPKQEAVVNNDRAFGLIDRLCELPEPAQNAILKWFNAPMAQWGTFSDSALDKLAEQIAKAEKAAAKVEASTGPSGPQGGEGDTNPPTDPPAPPAAPAGDDNTTTPGGAAAPLTAAERAAARGSKKALGAVKNAPVADEDVQAHFPGSEVVAS